MKLRVLTIDDHPLVRMGVRSLIDVEPDMELAGEAMDGATGLRLFDQLRPDITLLDLQLPDRSGLDVLRAIRDLQTDAKVVILTTYRGDVSARHALSAGAVGYLLKNALGTELAEAIRIVANGGTRLSPEIEADLATHRSEDALTTREMAILEAAADGSENKEIARQLGISVETVKWHIRSILAKLNARNRTDALRIASTRGLLRS